MTDIFQKLDDAEIQWRYWRRQLVYLKLSLVLFYGIIMYVCVCV